MHKARGFTPLEKRIPNREGGSFLTGFTLIELLVVIAIIALLMAILMPSLQKVRKQARAVACRANLKQWGTTLALYTEDNQGHLPFGGWWLLLRGSSLRNDDPNWRESANPVDTKGIACCPMAIRIGNEVPSTFRAWEERFFDVRYRGSYGFNARLLSPHFDSSVRSTQGTPDIFSLRGRANIPTLLDSARPEDFLTDSFSPPRREGAMPLLPFCINRHNGHVNGLFLDWSVRKVGLKELWTLKWYRDFDTAGPYTKAGGVLPEDWPKWMRSFKDY